MAQLKPHAHVVMKKAAQRGTLVTEGDSGTMLVNRLYAAGVTGAACEGER